MERKITKKMDWEEVRQAIYNSSDESSIYIGCDSQDHGRKTVFGVAVVIHIDSCRGGKMFVEISNTKRIKSVRQRLMKEVEIVVEGAMEIVDNVGKRRFEVHLDVTDNPDYMSSLVCKAAVGYVKGQGLNCEIKPNAFVATHCADMLVRK